MLCERGILLEDGAIKKNADAASVMDYDFASQVRRYEMATPNSESASDLEESAANLGGRESKAVLTRKSVGSINVELLSPVLPLHSGDPLTIEISTVFNEAYADPHIGFGIRNKMGIVVYEANTYTLRQPTRSVKAGEKFTVSFTFSCRLWPGTYELIVGVADGGYAHGSFERVLFHDQSYLIFEVFAASNHVGWSGLWDIEPEITVN